MKVCCVAGARPNFMKVKPVLDALERLGLDTDLIHTGQHYDAAMSDVFFSDLGLRSPDVNLGVASGSHAAQTARVMVEFENYLERAKPVAVVVFGDINSTLACSIVAAKAGCLTVHVEAGLRSRDWSMPEEVNRMVADRLADLLFAPSQDAVDNLRAEGYREDQIHLAGNVMIDTLMANSERARRRPTLANLGVAPDGYGVVTLHRPSNVDDATSLLPLVAVLNEISEELPLVFPAHPRTAQRLGDAVLAPGLHVVEPLGYLDFLALQSQARLVMTDSGGVQEETTALGIPCLTLRENTERPITISEGTNRLVGTDPAKIRAEALDVLDDPPMARCPALWDGHAGDRIAAVINDALLHGFRRPTDADV